MAAAEADVTAATGDTRVFSPQSWRRVTGPTGRGCRYVRKTQLEMAAAASAGHTRPPRDRNLNRLMVLGLPNPFKPQKEGSTGMTVPATAATLNSGTRTISLVVPRPMPTRDMMRILATADADDSISDTTFRFLFRLVTAFGDERFTTLQAVDATGNTVNGVSRHLGALVQAGLAHRGSRVVVGENEHGRPVRTRIYRLNADGVL